MASKGWIDSAFDLLDTRAAVCPWIVDDDAMCQWSSFT
jgi:hypothetical protein